VRQGARLPLGLGPREANSRFMLLLHQQEELIVDLTAETSDNHEAEHLACSNPCSPDASSTTSGGGEASPPPPRKRQRSDGCGTGDGSGGGGTGRGSGQGCSQRAGCSQQAPTAAVKPQLGVPIAVAIPALAQLGRKRACVLKKSAAPRLVGGSTAGFYEPHPQRWRQLNHAVPAHHYDQPSQLLPGVAAAVAAAGSGHMAGGKRGLRR
jgi:hypothetical protein